jgi:DNA primase catalytic subunit
MERNQEPGAMHAVLISSLIYVEYSLRFNGSFGFHVHVSDPREFAS